MPANIWLGWSLKQPVNSVKHLLKPLLFAYINRVIGMFDWLVTLLYPVCSPMSPLATWGSHSQLSLPISTVYRVIT